MKQPAEVRMIDRLRANGSVWFPPRQYKPDDIEKVIRWIRDVADAPVVVADNVTKYFYESCDKAVWRLDEDFPNILPPFDAMWIETKAPAYFMENGVRQPWVGPLAWGAFIARRQGGPENKAAAYTLDCISFIELHHDRERDMRRVIDGPQSLVRINVDARGVAMPEPDTGGYKGMLMCAVQPDRNEELIFRGNFELIKPLLLAISFMHCRNVTMQDHEPPAKLAKRYAERHDGAPLVKYKTLDIQPFRKAARAAHGGEGEPRGQHALHICRGHFKNYSAEKPLLGKHVGMYWWDSMVRGNAERGRIEKTYRMGEIKQ